MEPDPVSASLSNIAVIGGGLAGIACAVRLAESGRSVTLIETRKRLGGRATSLVDPRSGLTIDNCQHVVLGCCTNLLDLYRRLDVLHHIHWHRELFWTSSPALAARTPPAHRPCLAPGEFDAMRPSFLPAPLHLARSLNRMRLFSTADKRAIARAMWKLLRLGSLARITWQHRTFADFLAELRQPPHLVENFWNTIIISACNLPAQRVGAAYAMHVFQEGFLANKFGSAMGLSLVPLAELYEPALEKIIAASGSVELGLSAKAIAFDGARVTGVVTDEGFLPASAVVSAVPFDRLEKLASHALLSADARLQHLGDLHTSPILGVHLWFPCQVMSLPHLVLAGGDVQWLFNKGVDQSGVQHIHAVISAADHWMDLSEDQIIARTLADIHHALPASLGRTPLQFRTIKEKRATFAPLPGIERFRPPAGPSHLGPAVPNLFLAGDWCDTGWPATMEGAVRSGYAAAHAITNSSRVVPDLPTAPLAYLVGLR